MLSFKLIVIEKPQCWSAVRFCVLLGRSFRNESSKDMAFPHPKSRKENHRKEDKPNSGGVLWHFCKRSMNIAEDRIENVCSLPSRPQCIRSSFQGWDFIQSILKFFRNYQFRLLLKIRFQTGLFHFNGLINSVLQDGFHLNYISNIGELNLAPRLRILPRFG